MPKPRSPRSFLLEAIEVSESPIYLLDSHRKLRFGNRAFRDQLGPIWLRLENRVLKADSSTLEPDLHAWLECLSPPPHVMQGAGGTYTVFLPSANVESSKADNTSNRSLVATCLPFSRGDTTRWFVTWSPLTAESRAMPASIRELHDAWASRHDRRSDRGLELLSGDSAAAARLRDRFGLAANSGCRVAIYGPEGSGRERLGRLIHSRRSESIRGPLLSLDCTLLDAELLQTTYRELVRSARLENSAPGCLLLTEIDRLVDSGQQELLNLLRFPQVPFTTLVTSRRPLEQCIAEGTFDRELAERLETLVIEIPSLASRREDLPLLAHGLLVREVQDGRGDLLGWSDEALDRLQRYDWPGNFQELEDLVRHLAQTIQGAWIQVSDLPRRLTQPLDPREASQFRIEPMDLEKFLREVEAEIISLALAQTGGNKTKAARLLGLSRGGLHRRLEVIAMPNPQSNSREAQGG